MNIKEKSSKMAPVRSYRCFHAKGAFLWMFFTTALILIACRNDDPSHADHPVAGMNTEQTDSLPGMEMPAHIHDQTDTIRYTDQSTGQARNGVDETYWLSLPANQTVIARQEVVTARTRDTVFSIAANGYIRADARRNHKVPARVGGRIVRLYVKFNYQYVHKGEKIADLYSPELNTYVEEYLYVRRSTNDSLLQKRAREKLLLLGLSSTQISQIVKAGRAPFSITMYSPMEGYVLFDPSGPDVSPATEGGSPDGMKMNAGGSNLPTAQATILSAGSIREGMYISKGQTLFWINDFRQVWGILVFAQQDEKYIQKGQAAAVQSELLPGQSFRSVIQFTEPAYQQGQKFTQARIYLPNPGGLLKENSLIKATISLPAEMMIIPASAVLYMGRTAIVWVQTGTTKEGSAVFQSRVVQVGRKTGNMVEITDGLQPGEAVAKDAAYLADSETIIHYEKTGQ